MRDNRGPQLKLTKDIYEQSRSMQGYCTLNESRTSKLKVYRREVDNEDRREAINEFGRGLIKVGSRKG